MFPAGDVCGGSTAGVSGRGGFGGRRRKRKWRRGGMEEPEMQLKVKKVTDKFTESMYVLANEPSVALYRLQEHVRRSLPELAQHKSDMQSWEEQSQGAIYTVEYACSAIKNMTDSSVYFKSIDSLLKHAIAMKDQLNAAQGRSAVAPQAKNPPASS
ncbi:BLOC-1-related complex subunit 8 isoform X1 [Falco biarmicus]|nr:BLOC-1-related complex subunit 8 isoform X1 [Falco peregrinus]XP_005444339.2 BLOC-1-related complex subunit 8 isoform X1 [Falco cherrug]XP_056193430.1 BLOC-1-related complex subunit 8 isoform X1 [Falco biarmicus]